VFMARVQGTLLQFSVLDWDPVGELYAPFISRNLIGGRSSE
jgi:hypothetical protein